MAKRVGWVGYGLLVVGLLTISFYYQSLYQPGPAPQFVENDFVMPRHFFQERYLTEEAMALFELVEGCEPVRVSWKERITPEGIIAELVNTSTMVLTFNYAFAYQEEIVLHKVGILQPGEQMTLGPIPLDWEISDMFGIWTAPCGSGVSISWLRVSNEEPKRRWGNFAHA